MLFDKLRQIGDSNIDFLVATLRDIENKKAIDVVFSGTLSNGKSTLINALLGEKLLPMRVGSTTSVITILENGDEKIIVDEKEYELTPENVEKFNNENKTIRILTPKIANKNVRFIDTPGINDILEEKEAKTFNFVPSADAFVFVIDASKGLTKEEKEFFEKYILPTNKDKIFVVLNKIDLIDEEIEVEKLVYDKLKQEKIYPLSAKRALVGKLKNDNEKLKESNFLLFEKDINEYIQNLDKQKIINKRKREILKNIEKLVDNYFLTIINSISKQTDEINKELKELEAELNSAIEKKEKLEEELNRLVSEIKECIDVNLNKLDEKVGLLFNEPISHKEELVERFNKNFPLFLSEVKENLKKCLNKNLDVEVNVLDDILITILTKIDDILAGFVSVLTMVPGLGKKIEPFVPFIQEAVRRLADTFGGKLIESRVKEEIGRIFESIKSEAYFELEKFKEYKLLEYEANELGVIKGKINSLNKVLELKKDEVSEQNYKIEFYKKELKEIKELIKKELDV